MFSGTKLFRPLSPGYIEVCSKVLLLLRKSVNVNITRLYKDVQSASFISTDLPSSFLGSSVAVSSGGADFQGPGVALPSEHGCCVPGH